MKDVFKLLCTLFCALIISNCGQGLIDEIDTPIEENNPEDLLIEPGDTPINAEEAAKIAMLFSLKNNLSTKANDKTIQEVQTIENGNSSMHIVNFNNHEGFVIVGNSRKYYPILAFSEKGSFDTKSINNGINGWINEQFDNIAFCEKLPASESIQYSALWEDYTKKISSINNTKDGDPINTVRSNFVSYWESQGYTCYELSEQPSNMPDDVYSSFCNTALATANTDYDYMTFSIILEQTQYSSFNTGNLVQVTWDQQYHFNDSIATPSNPDPKLGCTTVAVGQVMKSQQKPAYYNWSAMHNDMPTPTTAAFLRDVHDAIKWYLLNNYSDPWSAKNYLVDVGYTHASVQSHDLPTVRNNLTSGHPVIMSGWDGHTITGGHTWVCSGYRTYNSYVSYSLWVVSTSLPLEYVSANNTYSNTATTPYYYMNWGYWGEDDGWFLNDSVQKDSNNNYQYLRTEIINIY